MIRPDVSPRLLIVTAGLVLGLGCRGGTDDVAPPGEEAAEEAPEAAPLALGGGACKVPAANDARLAEGLERYLRGDWREAVRPLQEWAGDATAAADPAAGRGLYSLAYALSQLGRTGEANGWYAKARVVLEREADQAPTLEGLYYLASLLRRQQDVSAQLDAVSRALKLLETDLCPAPDGDDDFRHARLASFAGQEDLRWTLLERASEKYAAGKGSVVAYHGLAEQELAGRARESGAAADWERHARRAAELDPSLPGVHRSVGLALLAQDDVAGAAAYWRAHWRQERQRGNALVYAIRVLQKVERHRKAFGDEHRIETLGEYTPQALEQNAIFEARRMLELGQAIATAEEPDPVKELEHDVAEYRMAQLLTEYAARDRDIQEFALQNGLLPAIHGSGLPRR